MKARSPQVRLRRITPADVPTLFEYQLDPESNQMAVTIPRTWPVFEERFTAAMNDPKVVPMAILADQELVGSISCFQAEDRPHVGYWIARSHWGRGIATQAVRLLLDEVKLRPLYARVATTNGASRRVLESCGFVAAETYFRPGDERFPACEEVRFILG